MEAFLPAIVAGVLVTMIMIKQIKAVTNRLDSSSYATGEIYSKFASLIQEIVREIKYEIDPEKEVKNPRFILTKESSADEALEKLSDMIRTLVFFETMNAKRKPPKEVEGDLFALLESLDNFLTTKIENGEVLADEIREKLSSAFSDLKN